MKPKACVVYVPEFNNAMDLMDEKEMGEFAFPYIDGFEEAVKDVIDSDLEGIQPGTAVLYVL